MTSRNYRAGSWGGRPLRIGRRAGTRQGTEGRAGRQEGRAWQNHLASFDVKIEALEHEGQVRAIAHLRVFEGYLTPLYGTSRSSGRFEYW